MLNNSIRVETRQKGKKSNQSNQMLWFSPQCNLEIQFPSQIKPALVPISDPKKSKALNLSVKQEPIQISDPHQAKWINFERKTCTNSDFRLNDQIW